MTRNIAKITTNIPPIPYAITGSVCKKAPIFNIAITSYYIPATKLKIRPPAITDAI